jgi:protein XagA
VWRVRQERAKRAAFAACLAVGFVPQGAHGGAWLQPSGQGQIIFNPSAMTTTSRFDRRGRATRIDGFAKQDNAIRVEYGIREDVTLILHTLQRTEMTPIEGGIQAVITSGIGGGARLALWRGERSILSAQITGLSGIERSMPALDRRVGPRHEIDIRVLAGQNVEIAGLPAFVEAQAGYRWRGGRHAGEARLDMTLGIRPVDRVLLLVQSLNTLAVTGTGAAGRPRQHKLQASIVYDLTETWSVQAGAFVAVAGRDALREQGVLLGLWRKF